MHISANACFFSTHHKCNLAVGFQPYQAINNMAACFFKHFCPYNIILFIKPCLQLHKYRYLLAIFCCLRKGCDNRGIAADTVQSLLDSQYIRILCSLAYKINYRIKAHVWMMKENISFTDHLENIFVVLEGWYRSRHMLFRLVLLIAFHTVNFHQHGKIQRTVNIKNILILDLKLCFQDIQQSFICFFFYFHANHFAPLTFLQLFLDLNQQILCSILINGQVCITHDPVRMCTYHVIPQEQLTDIFLDHFFQKDHCCVVFFNGWDLDHSRKHGGNLHSSKYSGFFSFFLVPFGNQCANI